MAVTLNDDVVKNISTSSDNLHFENKTFENKNFRKCACELSCRQLASPVVLKRAIQAQDQEVQSHLTQANRTTNLAEFKCTVCNTYRENRIKYT